MGRARGSGSAEEVEALVVWAGAKLPPNGEAAAFG